MSGPVAEVLDQARHRWGGLLPQVMDLRHWTHRRHQPCPVCGGRDRFRLFPDWEATGGAICNQCGAGDGLTWWQRLTGLPPAAAARDITGRLGLEGATSAPRRRPPPPRQEPAATPRPDRRQRLVEMLAPAIPLGQSTTALAYLAHRGLGELIDRGDLPPGWFAHPGLPYWELDDQDRPRHLGDHPALVAPVRSPAGQLVSVHRTYLAPDGGGKAAVESPKKLAAPIHDRATHGAAIPLYPCSGEVLALTEGIETALAVRLARPEFPVWACVTAGGLARWQSPAGIRAVWIMADRDRSGTGQQAARALRSRLGRHGLRVRVCLPPGPIPDHAKGLDWLDVLCTEGEECL
ncbi:DUF7146 domain-containing protein [Halomonas ramblicola]|uniref:DUF7146 domain-containing protein n=1 Tax=Halomonas ramblicola TaxID=747349 RepID=UPI0025B34617|nr:toprim domain-containing protein [Halomonas ramblicola]MDN3521519.1 toprim domain-containing protein [Halomonas ramblicola]